MYAFRGSSGEQLAAKQTGWLIDDDACSPMSARKLLANRSIYVRIRGGRIFFPEGVEKNRVRYIGGYGGGGGCSKGTGFICGTNKGALYVVSRIRMQFARLILRETNKSESRRRSNYKMIAKKKNNKPTLSAAYGGGVIINQLPSRN